MKLKWIKGKKPSKVGYYLTVVDKSNFSQSVEYLFFDGFSFEKNIDWWCDIGEIPTHYRLEEIKNKVKK